MASTGYLSQGKGREDEEGDLPLDEELWQKDGVRHQSLISSNNTTIRDNRHNGTEWR